MPLSLEQSLKQQAKALGFDVCGIATLSSDAEAARRLSAFLAAGRHGDMQWLASTGERRKDPLALWPAARSAIMLGMNYTPSLDPLERLKQAHVGNMSVYALGDDYHTIIRGRLQQLARRVAFAASAEVKLFVDTAPLMEKPLAQKAGIGWQGKHTNLVSRQFGSWLFLGAVLTTAELTPDTMEEDHCGSCRACLDICPTNAFPAPYQLDARRCISYLTIEHKGHIDVEFRSAIGNRIFGCDDCLAVCPWNKFARTASEAKLHARSDLENPTLAELLTLDDRAFRAKFSSSAVKRTGRNRFVRNVLIAAGNSRDSRLNPVIIPLLKDESPLVRAMAVWALSKLMDAVDFASLRNSYRPSEADAFVNLEWDRRAA
ncbi:MAG TPA: tRNA epoxyqueuosine(34) reductase QueG [Aestuariivirgaceae bacterium]